MSLLPSIRDLSFSSLTKNDNKSTSTLNTNPSSSPHQTTQDTTSGSPNLNSSVSSIPLTHLSLYERTTTETSSTSINHQPSSSSLFSSPPPVQQQQQTPSFLSPSKPLALRQNIKVCLRLRPMNKLEESRRSRHCVEVHENETITLNSPLDGVFDCSFDKVFDEKACQKEVYEYVAASIPGQLLAGYNCTVIAYGQTGSGKTHTMIGAGGDSPNRPPTAGGGAPGATAAGPSSSATNSRRRRGRDRNDDDDDGREGGGGRYASDDVSDDEGTTTTDPARRGAGGGGGIVVGDDDPNYETSGMIPRVIRDLFRAIEESSPSVEFTVRCSCIEIYLERILDLLDPSARNLNVVEVSPEDDDLSSSDEEEEGEEGSDSPGWRRKRKPQPFHLFMNAGTGVYIEGMTEACCFDEADVMALFVRGNATRTVSSTRMNTDSSRSHAIFIVTVEQRDTISGVTRTSRLHMVDLAGSEISGVCKRNRRATAVGMGSGATPIQQEAMMINKSLASLGSVVRALTESKAQKARRDSAHVLKGGVSGGAGVPYKSSKLTRVLKEALGGNCLTTFILTASPSSYNISETINTIKFGQRSKMVVNKATMNEEVSVMEYKSKLQDCEKEREELQKFVKAMARECWNMRQQGVKAPLDVDQYCGPLWDTIQSALGETTTPNQQDSDETSSPAPTSATTTTTITTTDTSPPPVPTNTTAQQTIHSLQAELQSAKTSIQTLTKHLHRAQSARDHSESLLAEVQSGLAVLRTQNETLTKEKKKITLDLINAKNEVELLTSQKLDLETRFRTSQFRENEATIFLRQFRMFYRRLLRNKAAHGTGDVTDIIIQVPDVPDLQDLVDIDIVLFECGLIEEDEMNDDQTYIESFRPSAEAMTRSTQAAQKQKWQQQLSFPWELGRDGAGGAAPAISNGDGQMHDNAEDRSQTNPSVSSTALTIPSTNTLADPQSQQQQQQQQQYNQQQLPRRHHSFVHHSTITTLQPHPNLPSEKEKELTADLRRMTERCIELQISLNQEKSNVDVLTNRSGSLRQKRLAQEAISLRKELDRKTHDVQLIIWKMNELNMINKAYNEKMKNRDHHVNYLEECLVDLQNVNKGLVADKLESEGKLREGLENLQALVDAMTVPLWQFGEEKSGSGGTDGAANATDKETTVGRQQQQQQQQQQSRHVRRQHPSGHHFRPSPKGSSGGSGRKLACRVKLPIRGKSRIETTKTTKMKHVVGLQKRQQKMKEQQGKGGVVGDNDTTVEDIDDDEDEEDEEVIESLSLDSEEESVVEEEGDLY